MVSETERMNDASSWADHKNENNLKNHHRRRENRSNLCHRRPLEKMMIPNVLCLLNWEASQGKEREQEESQEGWVNKGTEPPTPIPQ